MVSVRCAKSEDVDTIKQMADAHRLELGFIHRSALEEGVAANRLFLAEQGGIIVGFVHFRHCRDGGTTIYEICVSEKYRGNGIGRALIDAVYEDAQK